MTGLELETSARVYRQFTNPPLPLVDWMTIPPGATTSIRSSGNANARIVRKTVGGKSFTAWACATLRLKNVKNGSGSNSRTRAFARSIGRSNDDAGHIFAQRLGFTGKKEWNIMPMSVNSNRGSYRVVEGKIASFLRGKKTLTMYVRGQY